MCAKGKAKDLKNGVRKHVFRFRHSNKSMENCEIDFLDGKCDADMFLNIPSGKLVLVNAGELIQCMSYPELEMEKILELKVEKGIYAVKNEGIEKISCYKSAGWERQDSD